MFKWLTNLLPAANVFGADRSPQWRRVRAEHLRKEPACQACGRNKDLQVHHIIPVAVCKICELDPDNLITLCADPCHLVFGHFLSYRCYNKDVKTMAAAYKQAFDRRDCPNPHEDYHDARV